MGQFCKATYIWSNFPDLELERCAKTIIVLGELTANISAVLKPVSHRSCHAKSLKRRSATHSDYLVAHLVRKSLQCISIHFASVLQVGGVSVHLGWHRSTQQTISIRPRAGAATQVRPSFGGETFLMSPAGSVDFRLFVYTSCTFDACRLIYLLFHPCHPLSYVRPRSVRTFFVHRFPCILHALVF